MCNKPIEEEEEVLTFKEIRMLVNPIMKEYAIPAEPLMLLVGATEKLILNKGKSNVK